MTSTLLTEYTVAFQVPAPDVMPEYVPLAVLLLCSVPYMVKSLHVHALPVLLLSLSSSVVDSQCPTCEAGNSLDFF